MRRLRLRRSGPWISTAALACLLWVCVASALFAPWWGVAKMMAVWAMCALVVLGWARPHPARTVYVPLAGARSSGSPPLACAGGVGAHER
ncbi:MAG: hypothetical protein H0V59_10110 [Nocardioidaceae bacterium]|nr:hypothetical protein [Nocardioidaceae bacterium]